MNLQEIKAAVDNGETVNWSNSGYTVVKDKIGQYFITHERGNAIGLTWQDGKTLNGKEEDFFLKGQEPIDFTRVNSDSFGNPRYVCHYRNLLTESENSDYSADRYATALKRAKKLGGRKFHNKQYGGGVVFQSYNIEDTTSAIWQAIREAEQTKA